MTSISGSMSTAAMMSPNDRMKLQLQSAVSAGTVKSADQSALTSALDDIDSAMKAGAGSSTGTKSTDMKDKIGSLIDQEVSDGKLTDDQATELKQVFAQAAPKMGGAHHAHGAGGPPPIDDDSTIDATDSTTTTDAASSTDATSSTGSVTSAIDTLMAFLKKLEQSMTSTSTYGSTGSSNAASTLTSSSLLVDAQA